MAKGWAVQRQNEPLMRKVRHRQVGTALFPPELPFFFLFGFFAVALALGGAGSRYPLVELLIELSSLPVLFCFACGWTKRANDRWSNAGLILLGLVLLIPVLQLVPLPAAVQEQLPGRNLANQIRALAGGSTYSAPISLDPEATWRCLLELLTGAAAFLGVLTTGRDGRSKLAQLIVAFAILSVLLGALQAAGVAAFQLFDSTQAKLPTGLFTNRNHQALFLDVAIILTAALARVADVPRMRAVSIAAALMCLFAAGVIATGSRTGLALMCFSLAAAATIMSASSKRRLLYVAIAVVIAVAAVSISSAGQVALGRFYNLDDARFSMWADTKVAVSSYWPVGSGLGTFPNVFNAFESLDSVAPEFTNHAHDDYLELLLEGGLAAVVLFACAVALIGAAATHRIRTARTLHDTVFTQAAAAVIVIILAHSLVDYPLRMLSLMTVFGFAVGLLFYDQRRQESGRLRPTAPFFRVRSAIAAVLLVGIAAEAIVVHLATFAVANQNLRLAETLSSHSPDASTWLAEQYLGSGRTKAAAEAAENALRVSPIHAGALSVLGLSAEASGQPMKAAQLMDLAAQSGWRDPVAQAWLLQTALRVGAVDVAAQRADALLRQGMLANQASASLRQLMQTEEGRKAVIDRLAADPPWGGAFLAQVSVLSDSEITNQVELIWAMLRARIPIDSVQVASLVKELVKRNRFADAYHVWRSVRGSNVQSATMVGETVDQLQRTLRGDDSPFGWSATRSSEFELNIRARSNTGSPALLLDAQPNAAGVFLQRLALLPRGPHMLLANVSGAPSSALRLDVQCVDGQGPFAVSHANTASAWRFEVPPTCGAEWLRISLGGGAPGGVLRIYKVFLR